MKGSLKDRTLAGLFWALLQKLGSRGIAFVVMIILARLLTPEDFGLIGMIMIFIQISQTIVEGGFNRALIQKKDTDELDYSSVFWINLGVSTIMYIIVFISAPYIAIFYHQPELIQLVRVLSIVFIINAFSFVQEARLTKEMQFKTLLLVQLPSNIIGSLVSIWMAFSGYGVWSLVFYQLITRVAYAIQIWVHSMWMPLFAFHVGKAKELFNYGGKLLLSRLLTTGYNNMFLIIIGRFYPVASVGFYQNANNLVNYPSGTISGVLKNVTFPAFAKIQDDNIRLKKGYKTTIQQIFFILCPIFITAGVLAQPLFDFVFGEQWLPAVPYFQWLCVMGFMMPLLDYNMNIIDVKGFTGLHLKIQTYRRVIVIVSILIVYKLGIVALLIVQAADSILGYLFVSFYGGRMIDYSLKEQLKDLFPMFLGSVMVGLIVFFIDRLISDYPSFIRILFGGFLAVSLYLGTAYVSKWAAFMDTKEIVQKRIFKKV